MTAAGLQRGAAAAAITGMHDPVHRPGQVWSASMYVWHLVGVLRIGTERRLTLTHDPGRGITCWDENALAEAPARPAALACRRNAHEVHHLMDINRAAARR